MPLVIIWMIVIFLTSSFPDTMTFYQGTWLTRSHQYIIDLHQIDWDIVFSMQNPIFRIPGYHQFPTMMNKLGHVVVYSVLGWLCYRATRKAGKSLWICFAYATFDEIHQTFTPGRSSRLMDIALDMAMALLAILLAAWFYKNIRPLFTKKRTRSS